MSISQTQIKGTVVLNSDAGANITIGNSTATNAITGTTNINTSGTSNTTIGNTTVGGITTLSSNIISMKSTTSASGKIDIMAGDSSTGDVNILTGAFATGIIDIGGDSTTTNIRGGSVNIETTDDSSSTVNIMTGLDAIGTLTIGATNGVNDTITTLSGQTTINKLATPLTPIYAYGASITANQIGYVGTSLVPVNLALPAGLTIKTTVATLSGLTAGRWLFNALCITKPVLNNNMAPTGLLIKTVGASPTETILAYASTMQPSSAALTTSINISWVEDIAVGTTATFTLQINMNQATSTAAAFTIGSLTISNAGYLQGIRIA
jgi:hypothetical protein